MALVLDADENAYVTGWSTGNGTGQDYATVKYRANGVQLWCARYDGPDSQDDEAVAIALDTYNHVCVSGNSYDASASSDYLTVSYDQDGDARWSARLDDSSDSFDDVWAMAVDSLGSVFVTGAGSYQTPTERFLTVKYAQVGIDQLTPSSVQAGGSSFTLTVDGFGFLDGATALWNGSARPTTFIDSRQLTVDIPAADITSEAEVTTAAITVVNPGGATSPSQAISVVSANVGAVQSVTAGLGLNASVSTAPTQAGQAGIAAAVQNAGSAERATLTAATFTSNPASGTIFDAGGGITDLRLVGGDASDTVTARFYYPSTVTGEAEAVLELLYYTGSVWAEALSSGGVAPIKTTTDDLDGTVSGGRFTVVFDSTSTPAVTDLAGTVFIATFEGPRVAIEVVLADVTQLRVAVTDKQDARKLDQAIQALTAALQPRAWLDDSHPQDRLGDGVFSETRAAVNALVLLMRDRRSTVEDALPLAFITRVVQADRVIAVVAIEEFQAAAIDPKDVVKARIHLALGDALAKKELYGAAIECYSNAWRNVVGP